MASHDVVVVGSANIDLVVEVDHRPLAGQTVLGTDLVTGLGGKGANQAVAAARLGAPVSFVGCVGTDEYGERMRSGLAEAGVEVHGLRTVPGATGVALIVLTPDAENSIIVSPGANAAVDAEVVDTCVDWSRTPVVVTQLEIPVATVEHTARRAARSGSRLIVNAAPARALSSEVLAAADPLVVNETEAAELLGSAVGDPAETVEALAGLGPRSVVLTLGSAGSAWRTERPGELVKSGFEAARQVDAVDTTGAGDGFVGALAAALARGWAMERAVSLATEVAGRAVTRLGAQGSYPTARELGLDQA
jgi:ribokinase